MLIIGFSAPLDSAMPYIRGVTLFYSIINVFTLVGMAMFLAHNKLWNKERIFSRYWLDPDLGYWYELRDAEENFNILTLCGIIMFTVFAFPFIMRPIDALSHIKGYTMGLCAYILMLPGFVNVMGIYSMCNLHDLSWGNRPSTSGGTNMITDQQKKQEALKNNYKMFRANFVMGWLSVNLLYVIVIKSILKVSKDTKNDGEVSFL